MERRHVVRLRWAVVAVFSIGLILAHLTAGPSRSALSFSYRRDEGDGYINQTVAIENKNQNSVVPELRFTALDQDGNPLPEVRVRTVFGSDSGRLVVPLGWSYDILRFSGAGAHDVYDVRVTVAHLVAAKSRGNVHPLTAQPLDAAGHAVSRFSRFTAVRVTNTDPFEVSARVAYIVYDQPPEGETQQAISVTPVGGLVRVPGSGSAVVEVTGAATRAVARYADGPAVSVKAYASR